MSLEEPLYDEVSLVDAAADEMGIPSMDRLGVRRATVRTPDRKRLVSALVWGDDDPQLVLLHGAGQNAHTWDSVALHLGQPLVAIDLPSHGHSDPRPHNPLSPEANALDIVPAVEQLAPNARALVGMSLGGLTAIAFAHRVPAQVQKLALIDVTPGGEHGRGTPIGAFLTGPESYESFEAMFDEAHKFSPNRPPSSLRRGVRHNSVQREDGRWVWRHLRGGIRAALEAHGVPDPHPLWDELATVSVPVLLVRGGGPGSIVIDEDVSELQRRLPGARCATVEEAGHSIQGDRPDVLAGLLRDFIGTPS